MATKSSQLQIRVTPRQKATLKRLARSAGTDVSSYVLSRALPSHRLRFEEILTALRSGKDRRYTLAELHDFLAGLSGLEFPEAVAHADLAGLPDLDRNYVAAMVEFVANRLAVEPPSWTRSVMPLEGPWFATSLCALRLHLLCASPVAFKRRNLFVDATVGDRV
ncbi:MAG: hypothetical protein WEB88_11395 [Gemmatimonadota bacterium]